MKKTIKILTLVILTITSILFSQEKSFSLLGRWAYGWSNCVAVKGNIAYAGNGAYLSLINIAAQETPVEVSRVLLPSPAQGITLDGNYAYVADGNGGARIIDISDYANPTEVGAFETNGFCKRTFVGGNLLFLANQDAGLQIVDISNVSSPVEIALIDYVANDVFVEDNYVYIAHDYRGVLIYDISDPSNPILTGMFAENTLGYAIWVDGDYAYLGDSYGLRILDVSDKTNPVEKSAVQIQRSSQDIFFNNGVVYLANQVNGLNIIDAANPESPVLLSNYDTDGYSEGVWQSGGDVFVADGYGGMQIINAADLSAPVFAGSFSTAGSIADVSVKDNFIFAVDFNNGLQILEVTGKNSIERVAEYNPLGEYVFANCLAIENNFVYLGASDGMYIIDVSDVENPSLSSHFVTAEIRDIKISGDYAYIALPNVGFSVVDISDPETPEQTGSISGGFADALCLQGDYAYAVSANGLYVVDISNAYQPEILNDLSPGNSFGRDIAVKGNYAYVIGNSLSIVDISDYNNLEIVGSVFSNAFGAAIAVSGDDAYVCDGGLRTFNVADPTNPTEIGYYETGGSCSNLFVEGTEIYLADGVDGVYYLNNDSPTEIENETEPTGFYLSQNYPNPFSKGTGGNPTTTIEYSIPVGDAKFASPISYVTLKVYDVLGREAATLVNKAQPPGNYSVQFSAENLSSGIYFYKLEAGNFSNIKKMIVLK